MGFFECRILVCMYSSGPHCQVLLQCSDYILSLGVWLLITSRLSVPLLPC